MRMRNVMLVAAIIIMGGIAYVVVIQSASKFENTAPVASRPEEHQELQGSQEQPEKLTYLISQEDKSTFCNGENMDSLGYRNTINTEVRSDVSKENLSESELAKQIAILATDGMCQDVIKKTNFTVANGTVEIAPIEGWAGVSIVMCSCKPQVEVNMLRIPGISKVVWLSNENF